MAPSSPSSRRMALTAGLGATVGAAVVLAAARRRCTPGAAAAPPAVPADGRRKGRPEVVVAPDSAPVLDGEIPVSDDPAVQASWRAIAAAAASARGVDLGPAVDRVGDWTLDAQALRYLTALTLELRPRHVLEFGAGLSTEVIVSATAVIGSAVSSVDNDPEFVTRAAEVFADEPRVAVQAAPLVVRHAAGRRLPQFLLDRAKLASQRPADLVVIDGPPDPLGGREGVLYQALELTRPGTVVLVDDAARARERRSLARWRESLGDAIEARILPGFPKGLAAIVVARPAQRPAAVR